MDEIEKFLVFALVVCIIAVTVLGAIAIHDSLILDTVEIDMKLSYYLQVNDSMTNIERYDLALSVCEQAYSETENKLWGPLQKNLWIKNNAFRLVNIT